MTFYKFKENDFFVNTIEAYPKYEFYIQSGSLYLDNTPNLAGKNSTNHKNVPDGHVSLFEMNLDRSSNYIYPYLVKNGNRNNFKAFSKINFNTQFNYDGTVITSSYMMSSSITRDYYTATSRNRINAIKNTLNHYSYLSPHYQFNSDLGDKSSQNINLISIPSIFFGSSIKKGSITLSYYVTGSLIGQLKDTRRNGDLIQSNGNIAANDGKVAGVVLYNEGLILLTGSWVIDNTTVQFGVPSYDASNRWTNFGYGIKDSTASKPGIAITTLSASFLLEYSGTTNTQTITMLAKAPYGELNHSNNPTFNSSNNQQIVSGATNISERAKTIKNVVYSQFSDEAPEFKKVVYISKIALYDEEKKLIGTANIATPVRKTEEHSYIFKLKLDF